MLIPSYWRTGWDSNPRYPCRYAAFRVRYIQPLCHLSICGDMGTALPRQVLSGPIFSGPRSHRLCGEKVCPPGISGISGGLDPICPPCRPVTGRQARDEREQKCENPLCCLSLSSHRAGVLERRSRDPRVRLLSGPRRVRPAGHFLSRRDAPLIMATSMMAK